MPTRLVPVPVAGLVTVLGLVAVPVTRLVPLTVTGLVTVLRLVAVPVPRRAPVLVPVVVTVFLAVPLAILLAMLLAVLRAVSRPVAVTVIRTVLGPVAVVLPVAVVPVGRAVLVATWPPAVLAAVFGAVVTSGSVVTPAVRALRVSGVLYVP